MKNEIQDMILGKNSSEKNDAQAGFSFVELMVVVFIMGLLATLIIVNLGGVSEQAKGTKAQADLAALESAIEQYGLDMGNYPTTAQGLNALRTVPNGEDEARYRRGGYLKRIQEDPWGEAYIYTYPGNRSGGAYDVYSAGPDGRPNTPDDVLTWD